jgi:TRAP-type C4-dicarboxylate transport system substrate-binding protein
MSAEQTAEMEKKGVQVNRPDLAKFRDAALPLHQEYVGKNFSRELYDLIRAN